VVLPLTDAVFHYQRVLAPAPQPSDGLGRGRKRTNLYPVSRAHRLSAAWTDAVPYPLLALYLLRSDWNAQVRGLTLTTDHVAFVLALTEISFAAQAHLLPEPDLVAATSCRHVLALIDAVLSLVPALELRNAAHHGLTLINDQEMASGLALLAEISMVAWGQHSPLAGQVPGAATSPRGLGC
jgi:hypothetical protein